MELKGHPGKANLIVRRYLSRDSERSKFEIDGESSTVQTLPSTLSSSGNVVAASHPVLTLFSPLQARRFPRRMSSRRWRSFKFKWPTSGMAEPYRSGTWRSTKCRRSHMSFSRSTFLPQDRVAAFAMMSASERLRETQKAAGHRNLNTWHDVLIKEGKTCKAAQVVRSFEAMPSSACGPGRLTGARCTLHRKWTVMPRN